MDGRSRGPPPPAPSASGRHRSRGPPVASPGRTAPVAPVLDTSATSSGAAPPVADGAPPTAQAGPATAGRRRPARRAGPRRAARRRGTRLRIALVRRPRRWCSALTGAAWGLYRDVTAGITTTDVIAGGGGGGAQNILLVGRGQPHRRAGQPAAAGGARASCTAAPDTGVLNSDTIMLLHVPEDGGAAVAFSIPRDSYVDIPGYRRDKINAAYPATKARPPSELVAEGVRDRARIEAESAQAGRTRADRDRRGA